MHWYRRVDWSYLVPKIADCKEHNKKCSVDISSFEFQLCLVIIKFPLFSLGITKLSYNNIFLIYIIFLVYFYIKDIWKRTYTIKLKI